MGAAGTIPPVEVSSGSTVGGSAGQQVGLEQVLAAIAALAATVQTSMQQVSQSVAQQAASAAASTQAFQSQIADGLKNLSENITKVAGATDTDTGIYVRSSLDPADNQGRLLNARDQTNQVGMKMAWDAVINNDAMCKLMITTLARSMSQNCDHHDLGRFVVRVPSGPGTMDAKANA